MRNSSKILQVASICIIVALFVSGRTAHAQSSSIGLRAGLNFGSVSYSNDVSGTTISSVTGFSAGAQIDLWFNDLVALSPQLLFDQKGAHYESTGGFIQDQTLNYLELPLLLKVSLLKGDVHPYLFAGPAVGMFLSGKGTLRSSGSGTEISASIPDSQVSKLDISLDFGAGAAFQLSSGMTVLADVTYALGISNVDARSGSTNPMHSRDLRIMAGVMFPIGGDGGRGRKPE